MVLGVKYQSTSLTIVLSIIIIYFEEIISTQNLMYFSLLGFVSIALTFYKLNSVDIIS